MCLFHSVICLFISQYVLELHSFTWLDKMASCVCTVVGFSVRPLVDPGLAPAFSALWIMLQTGDQASAFGSPECTSSSETRGSWALCVCLWDTANLSPRRPRRPRSRRQRPRLPTSAAPQSHLLLQHLAPEPLYLPWRWISLWLWQTESFSQWPMMLISFRVCIDGSQIWALLSWNPKGRVFIFCHFQYFVASFPTLVCPVGWFRGAHSPRV